MRLFRNILIYTVLFFLKSHAQNLEWISTFGNNKYHTITTVSPDNVGNVFVSGWGRGYLPDTAREYPFSLKFDNNGNFKWVRTYPVYGAARSHTLDDNGNLYLLTSYEQFNVGIIKYNTLGDTVWSRIFTAETPTKIISDQDKFIYAFSSKRSPNMQEYDYFVIKLDTSGNLVWATAIDSTHLGSEVPIDMVIDRFGKVYITGYSDIVPITSFTVKLDSSGNLEWESLHQTGDFHCPSFSIALDNLGNCYVAGNSFHIPVGTDKYKIIKYDSNGNIIWEKSPIVGQAGTVLVDKSYNVYLSGTSGIVKMNSSGETIRLDSTRSDILLDENDNLYQFNLVFDSVISKLDRLNTIKKDSSGNLLWLKYIQLPVNYSFYSIAEALDINSAYIAASKSLNPGNDSILVIKYSQMLISIDPISSIVPKEFRLSQNYPNPFNPVTHFKFHIPKSTNIHIKIFDLLGRKVASVLNENLKPGEYKVSFNAVIYSSGIYMYNLTANDF